VLSWLVTAKPIGTAPLSAIVAVPIGVHAARPPAGCPVMVWRKSPQFQMSGGKVTRVTLICWSMTIRESVRTAALLMTFGAAALPLRAQSAPEPGSRFAEIQRLADQAYEHAMAGQTREAIADYDAMLRIDGANALAYNNRGFARSLLGDIPAALRDYDEAIRLRPEYAEAFLNRGVARATRAEYELSIRDFSEALRLNPRYSRAATNRGLSFFRTHDYERAIEDWDRSLLLSPGQAEVIYSRGVARRLSGDAKGGDADIAAATQLRDGVADEMALLGVKP
jgi:tetratricopeptide (TPR) repeat protein